MDGCDTGPRYQYICVCVCVCVKFESKQCVD